MRNTPEVSKGKIVGWAATLLGAAKFLWELVGHAGDIQTATQATDAVMSFTKVMTAQQLSAVVVAFGLAVIVIDSVVSRRRRQSHRTIDVAPESAEDRPQSAHWSLRAEATENTVTFIAESKTQHVFGDQHLTWFLHDPSGAEFVHAERINRINHANTVHTQFPKDFVVPERLPQWTTIPRGKYRLKLEARPDLSKPPILLAEGDVEPPFPAGVAMLFEDEKDPFVHRTYMGTSKAPETVAFQIGLRSVDAFSHEAVLSIDKTVPTRADIMPGVVLANNVGGPVAPGSAPTKYARFITQSLERLFDSDCPAVLETQHGPTPLTVYEDFDCYLRLTVPQQKDQTLVLHCTFLPFTQISVSTVAGNAYRTAMNILRGISPARQEPSGLDRM